MNNSFQKMHNIIERNDKLMKEGLFTMNEIKRITIIKSVIDKKRTQKEAAISLGISDRQVRNIIKKIKEQGFEGIKHKNKSHKPKHAFSEDFKQKIINLKLSNDYVNTNFSHFKDLLKERENINISYSALYNILKSSNINSKKSHRDKMVHRRRKRKDYEGLLVQTDGTPYDWFNIGKKYSLHGYIDDATGKILGLYMCENECLMGYLEITRQMLENYGSPVMIYSDKYSVFFPNSSQKLTVQEQLDGKDKPTTQFHRILDFLGIELIPASTSQAKGRIERLWQTLQDRLTEEFKLNNIKTIKEANDFLPSYIKKFNKQFAIQPKCKESKFIKLPSYVDLDLLLTSKLTRTIDASGTFSIHNNKFQIIDNNILPRSKVDIYISHKIGIIVVHNKRRYNVVCLQNLPSVNSTLNFNKMFQEHQSEVISFATNLCSYDAKTYKPLLTSS